MNNIWTSCTVQTAIIAAAAVLIVLFVLLLRRPVQRLDCTSCTSASDAECERCKCCHKNKLRIRTHLYYVLGYCAFVIVGLVTYITVGEQTPALEKYISFAATLSSLILAVIAIIYAIVSNQKGAEQYGKIKDATENISRISAQLGVSASALEGSSAAMVETSEALGVSIRGMEGTLRHIDDNTTRIVNEKMQNGSAGDPHPDKKTHFDVVDFCERTSFYGMCALLGCVYALKHERTFKETDLIPSDNGYIWGFLVAAKTVGFVQVSSSEVGIKVSFVDGAVKKNIEKIITRRIEGEDESWAEDVKRIKDFFGEK